MFKNMNNWILITALVIGGTFEVVKHFKGPALPDVAADSRDLGRINASPYARLRDSEKAMDTLGARAKAQVEMRKFQITSGQKQLIIPPQSGAFDSNPVAKAASAGDAKDKKAEADKQAESKKKCVQLKEMLVNNPTETETLVGELKKEQEKIKDTVEECRYEEKVADKEKSDKDEKADKDEPLKPKDHDQFKDADAGAFGGGLPTNISKSDEFAGLEEWKGRLLYQPNLKETVRLIESYQSGRISSMLFYTLVDLMLADSRPEMRELGVLAAGRTPSYESFHALIKVIKGENFDSKLRTRAETELATYQQLTYLSILERVLRTSDEVFAVIFAAKELEESAKKYLTAKYNPTGSGTSSSSVTKPHPYANFFKRFIVVLTDLTKSSHDGEEASQARQTLLSLQNLLKV